MKFYHKNRKKDGESKRMKILIIIDNSEELLQCKVLHRIIFFTFLQINRQRISSLVARSLFLEVSEAYKEKRSQLRKE